MRIKPSLIVRTLKRNECLIPTKANTLGIHRSTVYRWIKKAKSIHQSKLELSERGLKRKSTKPFVIHKVLSSQDEANIVSVRVNKQYTAEKIKKKLNLSVSVKTVHRTLKGKIQKATYRS